MPAILVQIINQNEPNFKLRLNIYLCKYLKLFCLPQCGFNNLYFVIEKDKVYKTPSGCTYEGKTKKGKKHGYGVFTWPDKSSYH